MHDQLARKSKLQRRAQCDYWCGVRKLQHARKRQAQNQTLDMGHRWLRVFPLNNSHFLQRESRRHLSFRHHH